MICVGCDFFLGVLGNGHEVNWVFQVFRVTSVETLTRGACHLHIEMDKDKRGEWWFTPVFLGRVKNDYVETTDPILSFIFPTQGKQLGRNCHSYSYTLLSRGANVSGTLALHPRIIRAFWANAQLRLAFVHASYVQCHNLIRPTPLTLSSGCWKCLRSIPRI